MCGAGGVEGAGSGGRSQDKRDARFLVNMLDAQDWEIVFEVYKGHPISALNLAQHLTSQAITRTRTQGHTGRNRWIEPGD